MDKRHSSHLGGLVNVSVFRELTESEILEMLKETILESRRMQDALKATTVSGARLYDECGSMHLDGTLRDIRRRMCHKLPVVTGFLEGYLQDYLVVLGLEEFEGVA